MGEECIAANDGTRSVPTLQNQGPRRQLRFNHGIDRIACGNFNRLCEKDVLLLAKSHSISKAMNSLYLAFLRIGRKAAVAGKQELLLVLAAVPALGISVKGMGSDRLRCKNPVAIAELIKLACI